MSTFTDHRGGMSRRGLIATSAAALAGYAGAPKDAGTGRRARPQLMTADRMFELAQALGVAKSRQDVPAALKFLHPDMVLECPAFGSKSRGLGENEQALTRFFATFPDYSVAFEGHASNEDTLVCWGTVRMTMTGDRFGAIPNGQRAELPVFIQFNFKDNLIARELFFFDLSQLCAQSGISTDAVRVKLFGNREEPAAPANE